MPWLAAIGALAGAGASAYSASQASDPASLSVERVPPPGDVQALRRIYARAIVQNMFNRTPSFGQFVESGGTAGFPIEFTGITPVELRQLRFVGNQGEEIPFGSTSQHALTPAQLLFLGRNDEQRGVNSRPARLFRAEIRTNTLEKKLEDPNISLKRRAKLENILARVKERRDRLLSRSTEFGLAGIPQDAEEQAPSYGGGRRRRRSPSGSSSPSGVRGGNL